MVSAQIFNSLSICRMKPGGIHTVYLTENPYIGILQWMDMCFQPAKNRKFTLILMAFIPIEISSW